MRSYGLDRSARAAKLGSLIEEMLRIKGKFASLCTKSGFLRAVVNGFQSK